MRKTISLAILLFLAGACSGKSCGGEGGDATSRDTLTQRQRDSIIGQSKLPGARGVKGALDVADKARARQARLDSIGRGR